MGNKRTQRAKESNFLAQRLIAAVAGGRDSSDLSPAKPVPDPYGIAAGRVAGRDAAAVTAP